MVLELIGRSLLFYVVVVLCNSHGSLWSTNVR